MAGQGELERGLDTRAMTFTLLQRDHCPPQMRHDLPVRERCSVDLSTGCSFVDGQEIFRIRYASDGILMLTEAPAFCEYPTDVFERIAEAGKFPVEHGGERAIVDQIVPCTVIAMDERYVLARRRMFFAPA